MVLGVVDITGIMNLITILYAICILNLIFIIVIFWRLYDHAKILRALVRRMTAMEDRYIKLRKGLDMKI